MYETRQNKEKVSHKFPSKITQKVQQYINDNRKRFILQKHVQENRSFILQFLKKSDLKIDMGEEFQKKHIVDSSGLPSMKNNEEKANILEAIYYHRDKKDRKAKQTMLFCKSTELCKNLLDNLPDTGDLSYDKIYASSLEYPAITILRCYSEQDNKYERAEFVYGNAKVKVKINQNDGKPSFNHLVGTEPDPLPNKVKLIP